MSKNYLINLKYFLNFPGELLKVNFKSVYEQNQEKILRKVHMFWLGWIGDRVLIKRMPIMNMTVLSGGKVSVCVCMDHMIDVKMISHI